MWLHVYVHTHSREAPHRPALRRRIPLELTREQLEQLERAQRRYGTKRATLVAGIEALTRLEALDKELAERSSACEQALAWAAELERKLDHAQAEAGREKRKVAAAKKANQTSAGVLAREGKLTEERDQSRRALANEYDERKRLEAELAQLERELFDGLHCARCGRLVPPGEWAVKQGEEGELVYHERCGFHRGGLTGSTSVLGVR
jgi:DNA repair exonuclease SbcCD ATPase subunit